MTKYEEIKFEMFKLGYLTAMRDLGLDYDEEDNEEKLRESFETIIRDSI